MASTVAPLAAAPGVLDKLADSRSIFSLRLSSVPLTLARMPLPSADFRQPVLGTFTPACVAAKIHRFSYSSGIGFTYVSPFSSWNTPKPQSSGILFLPAWLVAASFPLGAFFMTLFMALFMAILESFGAMVLYLVMLFDYNKKPYFLLYDQNKLLVLLLL